MRNTKMIDFIEMGTSRFMFAFFQVGKFAHILLIIITVCLNWPPSNANNWF